jgi:signal transduction histidine kinase
MAQNENRIIFSFRTRITIVLTLLLLLTFATLQYLNLRAQREVQHELESQRKLVRDTVDKQSKHISAAFGLAVGSFDSTSYLYDVIEKQPVPFDRERIRHLIVVKASDGTITDSTEQDLVGDEEGEQKKRVTLPPELANKDIVSLAQEGVNPVAGLVHDEPSEESPTDTYWFRVKTRNQDTKELEDYWIAVVVSTKQVSNVLVDSQKQLATTVQRTSEEWFWTTIAVFVLAAFVMFLLVWQFTRPVSRLADAAERVAGGDLTFKVGIRRRDEIGQLSNTFDEMIDGLRAKSELEDRLSQAERAAVIGRLTAAIAHEIRNPLNFINLSIDHVRSKYPPADAKARERFDGLLGSIKEETARLNRLVTDVLNFGRPANLNAKPVDIRDAVEQVLTLVRAQAENQGVTIEARMPAEPATVVVDVEKMKSCFSNLIINAIHAMPGGGSLVVTVAPMESGYRLVFADTGVGIPAEAVDRVFEPYYSTKDTGTGLGLAVTKKIVDEHGGKIRVESVVGRGTTFEVELPSGDSGDGRRRGERPELQTTVRG